MKMYQAFISTVFLIIVSLNAHAGWEVTAPQSSYPQGTFFQNNPANNKPSIYRPQAIRAQKFVPSAPMPSAYNQAPSPQRYASLGQTSATYAITISGSLKENIERIMSRYHWKVIWKSGNDYNFDGKVTGASLPNVIEKLLQPFPLQAVMYMANRTLVVTPRPLYRI